MVYVYIYTYLLHICQNKIYKNPLVFLAMYTALYIHSFLCLNRGWGFPQCHKKPFPVPVAVLYSMLVSLVAHCCFHLRASGCVNRIVVGTWLSGFYKITLWLWHVLAFILATCKCSSIFSSYTCTQICFWINNGCIFCIHVYTHVFLYMLFITIFCLFLKIETKLLYTILKKEFPEMRWVWSVWLAMVTLSVVPGPL